MRACILGIDSKKRFLILTDKGPVNQIVRAGRASVHLLLDQGADREGEDPGHRRRGVRVLQGGVDPGARAAGLPPCR